jgi:hypothetical protein
VLGKFRPVLAHVVDYRRHQLGKKKDGAHLGRAVGPDVREHLARGPAYYAPQDVLAALVSRAHAVGDKEAYGPRVVGEDVEGAVHGGGPAEVHPAGLAGLLEDRA